MSVSRPDKRQGKIGPVSTSKMYPRMTRSFEKYWELYLILIPVLAYFIIFKYIPMYGVQIAFKDFLPVRGILGSPWAGMKHFTRFFRSYYFGRLIKNTLTISLYQLAVGFPAPIILALMMNEIMNLAFKKALQMITYIPHFLSVVVVAGMVVSFLSPRNGFVNELLGMLGVGPVFFMADPRWFKSIYVFSGVWQNTGWDSIIYIAAISAIDPELYEAAIVDGATKLMRMIHITIPSIIPTAVILLILRSGHIMNIGFQKIYLLQNSMNVEASEVISTYVYKSGLLNAQYSFAAAVGLFNSVINCIILVLVNSIAGRVGETSLF